MRTQYFKERDSFYTTIWRFKNNKMEVFLTRPREWFNSCFNDPSEFPTSVLRTTQKEARKYQPKAFK